MFSTNARVAYTATGRSLDFGPAGKDFPNQTQLRLVLVFGLEPYVVVAFAVCCLLAIRRHDHHHHELSQQDIIQLAFFISSVVLHWAPLHWVNT